MSNRTASWLAWSISALAAAFAGLFLVLSALNSRDPEVITYEYWGAEAVTAIVFPVVGALIVSHYPANALGWLFCLMGFSSGLSVFASEYATYALMVEPGSLPGAAMAAWLGSWIGTPGFLSVALIPLLFPDGRPPSRRWRPLMWLAIGVIVAATVSIALMPGPLDARPPIQNPFGVAGARGVFEYLLFAGAPILGLTLVVGVVSLIVRYRRSRGTERQQLKWFAYAATLTPLGLIGNSLFPDFAWLVGGVGVALMPLAIGVAILRYRLYEIDLIINRTLVYGSLTATLALLYFGSVTALQYLFSLLTGQGNTLAIVASTLAIAALFNPLRRRIQSFIDRRFYRRKYDARKTLEAFGSKLRDETDLEKLCEDLAEVVDETMQPSHISLWLSFPASSPVSSESSSEVRSSKQ